MYGETVINLRFIPKLKTIPRGISFRTCEVIQFLIKLTSMQRQCPLANSYTSRTSNVTIFCFFSCCEMMLLDR